MAQHKALITIGVGRDSVVQDRPTPTALPGEVLVKIESAGEPDLASVEGVFDPSFTYQALNPTDWKRPKLGYFIREIPFIQGSDAAGVVEDVGFGAQGSFKKGDRV